MMTVKILGTGCPNCKRLEANAHEAVRQLGIEARIEKVEDVFSIMQYGVMRTPGLVINEKVVVSGRVPRTSEVVTMLVDAM